MLSRTFTIHHVGSETSCYKGFDLTYRASEMELVAIVLVEGSPEVFVLDDNQQARCELVRFLAEDNMYQGAVIAGIYRRSK